MADDVDLIFHAPPFAGTAADVPLVFGADEEGSGDTDGVLDAELPDPVADFRGLTGEISRATFDIDLPDPGCELFGAYDNAVSRGPRSSLHMPWQNAKHAQAARRFAWDSSQPVRPAAALVWHRGRHTEGTGTLAWDAARPRQAGRRFRYEEAEAVQSDPFTLRWEGVSPVRATVTPIYEEARPVQDGTTTWWQETHKVQRNRVLRYEEGRPLQRVLVVAVGDGVPMQKTWRMAYQEAMRPPHGLHPVEPPNPPPDLCWTPPSATDVPLYFSAVWAPSSDLIFVCDNHPDLPPATVVVPIQRVYLVLNTTSLINVATGGLIPTLSMSLSIDVDSWTWSFNASVPGIAQPDLEPSEDGTPVEVEATVNGTAFRFYVEGISRDRTFGKSALQITGRGKTASLDAPYARAMSFGNTAARTAQQLVGDILTDNGVSLGWDVTWTPEDWLVPAGVFSYQGTYIGAVNTVAAAAGAYVQPHNTDLAFSVLLRYPIAPWAWAEATPDFELPSAVTQRESITWAEKPRYNRVFVSGQQQGVLGRVTRAGTAGDLLADTITDALITTSAAARQRGLPILADTGRIATVGIKLPVLPETGIIPPGKLVRYTDGDVIRLGLTRAVSVDVGLPTVYQTLSIETHV